MSAPLMNSVKKQDAMVQTIVRRVNVRVVLSVITRHHRNMSAFRSSSFWYAAILSAVLLSAVFTWVLWYLPRPVPTSMELTYTAILLLILSLNSGLIFFRLKHGTCPIGAKRGSTIAGGLGIVTLLCPACLLIPISLFGISMSLTILAPYLPLLRVIVLFLLVVSTMMLLPTNHK